jgi:hypothetical protein
MVTPQHEALHRIFQHDRELFARTMSHVFHEDVPIPRNVSILDTDFTEVRPHMRRGDSVLLAEFLVEEAEARYIVVVESQLREDEEKERRWPYYIAYLHDKYECPVILLVVCNDPATADWARIPIRIGLPRLTCMTVTAWVLGPDNLDLVTDPDQAAEDVGLAVLAAITHSQSGRINDILEALAEALNTIDTSTAGVLAELIAAGVADTHGLTIWRALMSTPAYPYASPLRDWFREQGLEQGREQGLEQGREQGLEQGREQGREQGLVEGERGTVRMVLKARGLELTAAHRERLETCTDLATLKEWSEAALTATTVDEIFG